MNNYCARFARDILDCSEVEKLPLCPQHAYNLNHAREARTAIIHSQLYIFNLNIKLKPTADRGRLRIKFRSLISL